MSRVVKTYLNFSVIVLADSIICFDGVKHRMITIEANYPRMIHAETLTHRALSRNGASSRAIPFEKMVAAVIDNPFIPDKFPRSHKGMQANSWIESIGSEYSMLSSVWLGLRDVAVASARLLNSLGMSKQLANRIIEPFLMYKTIMSATEWENMLALRAHPDAQHEFQILANLMLEAFNESVPVVLNPGEWHVPFGDQFDIDRLNATYDLIKSEGNVPVESVEDLRRMIAAARCARISYNNFEGTDDYYKDIQLFHQLAESGHWSPFEHVAQAMTEKEYYLYSVSQPGRVDYGWCGNVRGFKQMRKSFAPEKENRTEPRLVEK